MASAQNNIEIDDFKGFRFVIRKETNHIYMFIVNNQTMISYEKRIDEDDLINGNISKLNQLYSFFKKGLYHEDLYEITIEIFPENIQLFLKKEFDDIYTIQTNFDIPKHISQERNDNMSGTLNGMLIHMEKKYEDKIERIREEHQMEISVLENRIQYLEQMMMGCSVIVGEIGVGSITPIPVVANINSTVLSINSSDRNHFPFQGFNVTEYYEGKVLVSDRIYFENIRSMKQLKKLGISTSSCEPIFDFGIINNGVLEELLLYISNTNNFRVDLSTIVKIPTLKKITMKNILAVHGNHDFKTYCSSNNIELIIL
jgi:hypothetical protein